MHKVSYFFIFLISIMPILLVTGPAIPDISITLAGIFFLIFIIYNKAILEFKTSNLVIISFLFWIYLLFVSLIAENKYLSIQEALVFFRILLIPIFIYYFISNKTQIIENIVFITFIAVFFVSIDTFYQFTQYKSESGFGKDLLGFESSWYGRLTGPFNDELIPGAYLSKFSLLGLLFLFIKLKKKIYLNFFSIIYLSFIGLIIFTSGERMALATYLMALIFLFIFYKNKRLIFFMGIILSFIFIFVTTKFHPFYNDYNIIESTPYHLGLKVEKKYQCNKNNELKCTKIINLQPEFIQIIKNFNISAYGEIYTTTIRMYEDHKLFGIGLNNFTYLCKNDERYKTIMKNYSCPSHPHNLYLQWLVETGLFGLLFFLAYLLNMVYLIYKNNYNQYSLIGIATLLILFWPIMSTGSLLKNWNGILTFYLIGISFCLQFLNKKTN